MSEQYPDSSFITSFRHSILKWGRRNIRSFPWRYQDDAYCILVSEFMLHRTQTRQVLPVYEKFILKYPSLSTFSQADPDAIRDELKSLGLGWRIDGMLNALHELWLKFGAVPSDYQSLISIKGIGQYIAGATLCFSQNKAYPLVDTNIVRVTGRVLGLSLSGEARRRKSMVTAIGSLVDPLHPRDYYYALIDIAHLLCRPAKPLCSQCPLGPLPCRYMETSRQSS